MNAEEETVEAPVLLSHDGPVAVLTLNRPDAANTVDLEFARAFRDAVVEVTAADSRVVVITSKGPVFCGGGDVDAMWAAEDPSEYLGELVDTFHDALERLAQADVVVVASIDGAAAGAGFGIALNADIVVATPRAKFVVAYAGVGLTPDSGLSYWLPRIVGTRRALDLSLTGQVLDARTAGEWGVVTEIVTESRLSDHVAALARRLATPGNFLAETRRLIRAGGLSDYRAHLDEERATIVAAAAHPATLARLRAFAERANKA